MTGGRPARRVLYISYNGLGTPLVRSQVLPYLRDLGPSTGVDLITFEQHEADQPSAPEIGAIRVHRLPYHKRPRLAAKLFDVLVGAAVASWLVFRHDIGLIHARSHVPAAMAAVAGALTRRPFIFDMRGFLGAEFAEAGAWRRGSLTERLVSVAERLLLRMSRAIVVLTERAREHLLAEPRYAAAVGGKPVAVVPCCVEIERFAQPATERDGSLVYVGSVGTWYRLDAMLRFFVAYRRARPSARFVIANVGQHDVIERQLALTEARAAVTVAAIGFAEIPRLLLRCGAGIVLLSEGGSKLASSPIKVAEYLAAGLPVVANEIVGDTPRLLRENRAGVVLKALDDASIDSAARELVLLLDEGHAVRDRARALAAAAFDAREGARRYDRLYGEVLEAAS